MTPVIITASEIHREQVVPTCKEKQLLLDRLERIEYRILQLHRRIFSIGEQRCTQMIRRLIELIREDEQVILSLCIARCDREDPDLSLDHDRTNNDHTLNLYAKLAIALKIGCRNRILRLHRLQREICERLKELGIDQSENARP